MFTSSKGRPSIVKLLLIAAVGFFAATSGVPVVEARRPESKQPTVPNPALRALARDTLNGEINLKTFGEKVLNLAVAAGYPIKEAIASTNNAQLAMVIQIVAREEGITIPANLAAEMKDDQQAFLDNVAKKLEL